MTEFPLVSVVMPVYNGEQYLREAIDSILTQTYRNFELIIIDDGSTDRSAAIIEEYRQIDDRVLVQKHSKNQGVVSSLNRGIRLARGDYLARMDADDISFPDRLYEQCRFLDAHNDIGIVGTSAIIINERNKKIGFYPVYNDDFGIRWTLLFYPPFIHPTVMIRRKILLENDLFYSNSYEYIEDYELWTRLLLFTKGANLEKPLFYYRINPESVTSKNKNHQIQNQIPISRNTICTLVPNSKLTKHEIINLCTELIIHRSYKNKGKNRGIIAMTYLDLWDSFLFQFQGKKMTPEVKQSVLSTAARLALFPPLQNGWLKAIRKLKNLDKNWFWFLVKSILSSFRTWIQNPFNF